MGTGFRKWGMTGGTVAGMVIADLLTGRDNPWVEVFDATRVAPQGLGTFVRESASVGKHFVADRLARLGAGDVADLAPGHGGIVWDDGGAVGAYRTPEGEVRAVSITCTHLGCSLKWNGAETSWDCPCHGSRFTTTGVVLEGPATQPLQPVAIEDAGDG